MSAPATVQRTRAGRSLAPVVISAISGVLLAVLWSYEFVDKVIGANVADSLLGEEASGASIASTSAGLVFAFVSGLAGTFTACNIAMAASIGPLSQAAQNGNAGTVGFLLRPLGWFTLGMVAVSAVYGAVGVLLGDRLPQLSDAAPGGVPARLIQSSVVFGLVGLALLYLGLAAAGVVRDVFAARPVLRVVVLGALVGAFLIGRPYPMFIKLFRSAAESGNPLYGAGTFVLQSVGNIALMAVLLGMLVLGTRGRFLSWLAAKPRRTAMISATLLTALGVFLVVYWDIRVPAMFGIGWFPVMPYN